MVLDLAVVCTAAVFGSGRVRKVPFHKRGAGYKRDVVEVDDLLVSGDMATRGLTGSALSDADQTLAVQLVSPELCVYIDSALLVGSLALES